MTLQPYDLCSMQTLGKRFKETMPKLKAAIAKLDRHQIVQYETTGSLVVENCSLEAGDLKVPPLVSNFIFWATFQGHSNCPLAFGSADSVPITKRPLRPYRPLYV